MELLPAETSASLIGQVHLAECLDLCERVYRAGVQVDMILADLPYGTTSCEWDSIIPLKPMWKAFKRIIKPNGVIVLTASEPFTSVLNVSNMDGFKYRWVWLKDNATGFNHAANMPLKNYEDISVFSSGSIGHSHLVKNRMEYNPQGLLKAGYMNRRSSRGFDGTSERPSGKNEYVTNYPRMTLKFARELNTVHPTQKPVQLFQYLIRTYTQPGELVIDPTCGSGTTGLAATIEKRRFICGDSDSGYVDIARNRLRMHNGDVSDLPLFAARPA
jgi:site-specific DNA-methyltransferase (adenine-specific)